MRSGPTKLFGTLMIFLKLCFKNIDFDKCADNKKAEKNTHHAKSYYRCVNCLGHSILKISFEFSSLKVIQVQNNEL